MKRLLTILIVLLGVTAFAQQDPLFTQYTYNKLLVNPAYAGSREHLNVTLINRSQWVSMDGAPETFTASAHAAMRNRKVGLGLYIFRDALGPTINNGFMVSYAYRLLMGRRSLSFGIQAGLKNFDFDWAKMNVDPNDQVFLPTEQKKVLPDVNVGIYYQSDRFFAGLSSKQLLENEYDLDDNAMSKLAKHFYLMSGLAVPLNESVVFRPSFLAKYVEDSPVQVDLTACVLFNNRFMVGAAYRTEKAVTFLTEFGISDQLRIGYSYDHYFNELNHFNNGSHEIRLEFALNLFKGRMKTPRYF
ncbi:type IX secretion system membrane protein PorP/SprF [Puteibacter caeruleilacunae]|nr:type IX secretion system membrane protein PorP/SprF [Puteibacter caeruleilacunae]